MKGYVAQSGESSYSTLPVSLALLFKSVISDTVSGDIGIGIGYYPIKIEEESSINDPQYGIIKESDDCMLQRFAPHFMIGLESSIADKIAIFGEIRYVLGKTFLEKTNDNYYFKDNFFFGGAYILIGIRFYPL